MHLFFFGFAYAVLPYKQEPENGEYLKHGGDYVDVYRRFDDNTYIDCQRERPDKTADRNAARDVIPPKAGEDDKHDEEDGDCDYKCEPHHLGRRIGKLYREEDERCDEPDEPGGKKGNKKLAFFAGAGLYDGLGLFLAYEVVYGDAVDIGKIF